MTVPILCGTKTYIQSSSYDKNGFHKPKKYWLLNFKLFLKDKATKKNSFDNYLTIFPQAWMGYEGKRNNCFSKIQLVGLKNIETKHLSRVKARHQSSFTFKTLQIWRCFSLLVGYNI